jgi:hypothetical protein
MKKLDNMMAKEKEDPIPNMSITCDCCTELPGGGGHQDSGNTRSGAQQNNGNTGSGGNGFGGHQM